MATATGPQRAEQIQEDLDRVNTRLAGTLPPDVRRELERQKSSLIRELETLQVNPAVDVARQVRGYSQAPRTGAVTPEVARERETARQVMQNRPQGAFDITDPSGVGMAREGTAGAEDIQTARINQLAQELNTSPALAAASVQTRMPPPQINRPAQPITPPAASLPRVSGITPPAPPAQPAAPAAQVVEKAPYRYGGPANMRAEKAAGAQNWYDPLIKGAMDFFGSPDAADDVTFWDVVDAAASGWGGRETARNRRLGQAREDQILAADAAARQAEMEREMQLRREMAEADRRAARDNLEYEYRLRQGLVGPGAAGPPNWAELGAQIFGGGQ